MMVFELKVDGVLMTPDGPDCWPKGDSNKQWLVFYRLDDMTFNGTGTIEGNGQKWWDLPCKPHKVYIYYIIYSHFQEYQLYIYVFNMKNINWCQ